MYDEPTQPDWAVNLDLSSLGLVFLGFSAGFWAGVFGFSAGFGAVFVSDFGAGFGSGFGAVFGSDFGAGVFDFSAWFDAEVVFSFTTLPFLDASFSWAETCWVEKGKSPVVSANEISPSVAVAKLVTKIFFWFFHKNLHCF